MQGEDLATLTPLGPGKIRLSDKSASLMALYNEEHLLAWLRHVDYQAQQVEALRDADIRQHKTPAAEWRLQLPPLANLTLTTSALQDGDYLAQWYDPTTATWLSASEVAVQGGVLTLPVPDIAADLALKVTKR